MMIGIKGIVVALFIIIALIVSVVAVVRSNVNMGVLDTEGATHVDSSAGDGGLRVCPDEWIQNNMPIVDGGAGGAERAQYFIFAGKRRELTEFDLGWIIKNCNLSPTVVY